MKQYRYKRGMLINGDCLKILPRIKTGTVDLVFADPPFNIGYRYDECNDTRSKGDYIKWTKQWIGECSRILKPTGSIFVAIGDEYAANIKLILDAAGLHMRNWIIWHYTFGVYCKTKFGRDHAHLLYFCKSPKRRTFNAGPNSGVRVPSSRQSNYSDRRADPSGRVPGDVWTFPRVCGTFKERNTVGHKCQMPIALIERIVKVASDRGQIVLDPFGGTGTTACAAKKLGRRFITMELSETYSDYINKRILNEKEDKA